MKNWRDSILKEFVPGASRLTLVADPDALLTEEKLVLELRGRGFDLIEFSDPVEFRYAYESQYRSAWDRGEATDLVVILRLRGGELDFLPYDLLRAGRRLSFHLGAIFPNLSASVVDRLDRSLLDELYRAQCAFPPDRMGENATKDYILRHVFGIAAEAISDDVELLRMLLRLHYGKTRLPSMLSDRLVQVLKGRPLFTAWPLRSIVPDENAFFAFLQERWPLFLGGHGTVRRVFERSPDSNLEYPGPALLPFDHHDIRVYIDNLFLEGRLTPAEVSDGEIEVEPWIRSGLSRGGDDDEVRMERLFDLLRDEPPKADFRYADWLSFAMKRAELASLVHCAENADHRSHLREASEKVNALFAEWLEGNYSSLINLPPTSPAMLHHIPRRMARDMEGLKDARAALIVVDGLSLDQWATVRRLLLRRDGSLLVRDSAAFAWIPTLTSISRQAIFAGKSPFYFPSSIASTAGEERLWKQFWEGCGFARQDILYTRGLGDGDASSLLESAIHPAKTRVAGLVVDKVDKIMHGMQLGSSGMHNQIKQWCDGGFLGNLIGCLLDYGFDVWLTSDHGNIECTGRGRPSEGVLAETRGERVRVYSSPELRAQCAQRFPFGYEWRPVGLPEECYPLLASGSNAFTTVGEMIVAHGGASLEEVVVPLAKIERRA